MEKIIEIKGLNTVFYTPAGKVQAAQEVNLTISDGEIWGLVGETGCGKSVLGQAILQLLPQNAHVDGEIWFRGKNLLSFSNKEIRRVRGQEIAYICQNPSQALNPVLKNGTQIMESVHINRKTGYKESRKISEELLKTLHFDSPRECMDSYPFQLSGGMKQRVLAAMGMSGNPRFFIADEPTKGLDALIRNQVVQTMEKFIETTNASALIITHDLKFAARICTHLAVMYAGELVEIGPMQELFSRPMHPYFKGLIEAQPQKGMKLMKGSACSLIGLPHYCRFYERCRWADENCKCCHPDLKNVSGIRKVRCIHCD